MNNQLKEIAVDFLATLKRERDERKFQSDMDQMRERLNKRHDEIMRNFRANLNVK